MGQTSVSSIHYVKFGVSSAEGFAEARWLRVDYHLHWCPPCRRMLSNLNRTVSALGRLAD